MLTEVLRALRLTAAKPRQAPPRNRLVVVSVPDNDQLPQDLTAMIRGLEAMDVEVVVAPGALDEEKIAEMNPAAVIEYAPRADRRGFLRPKFRGDPVLNWADPKQRMSGLALYYELVAREVIEE